MEEIVIVPRYSNCNDVLSNVPNSLMSSIPVDQLLHNFIPENPSVNAMHLHQLKSETCELHGHKTMTINKIHLSSLFAFFNLSSS